MTSHDLIITADGDVRCLYSDDLDVRRLAEDLGDLSVRRASHVEPTDDGRWTADMGPVGGPVLGPFDTRTEALSTEVAWLRQHHLGIAEA